MLDWLRLFVKNYILYTQINISILYTTITINGKVTTITGRVHGSTTETVYEGLRQEVLNVTVGGSQEPVSSDTFKLFPVCQLSLTWQNVEQF